MAKKELSSRIGRFTIIPNSFIESMSELGDHATMVFLALSYHVNYGRGDDAAFPSYDTIQSLTGLARSSVSKGIKTLRRSGWLECQRRFGKSTVYYIQYPDPVVHAMNHSSSPDEPSVVHSANTNKTNLTRLKELDSADAQKRSEVSDGISLETTLPSLKASESPKQTSSAASQHNSIDPVAHIFDRSVGIRSEAEWHIRNWNLPQHLQDICVWFAEDMSMAVVKSDKSKWAKGAALIYEMRPTREQFYEACKKARAQKTKDGLPLTYVWPGAMQSLVKEVVSKPAATAVKQVTVTESVDANGNFIYVY